MRYRTRYKAHAKNIILSVSDSFLALTLILNCHSIYERSVDVNFHIYGLTLCAILLNCAAKLFLNTCTTANFNRYGLIAILYAYIVLILISVSVSREYLLAFSARFAVAPLVILLSAFGKTEREKHGVYVAFVRWMTVITLVSVIFWLFGSFFHILSPTGTMSFIWGSSKPSVANSYYNIYFETQYADLLRNTSPLSWRNSGVFVEGPMFGLVLDIALLFYCVFKDTWQLPKKTLYILALGIITSFSTTSYLFAAMVYLSTRQKRKYMIYFRLIVLPLMLIAAICLLVNKAGTASFAYKIDDYRSGFLTWLESPIIGHGYNNWDAINKNKLIPRNGGYSSAVFAMLCQGGLLFFALYAYPMLKGLRKRRGYSRILAFMYFVVLISTLFHTAYINFYLWALLLEPGALQYLDASKSAKNKEGLLAVP